MSQDGKMSQMFKKSEGILVRFDKNDFSQRKQK